MVPLPSSAAAWAVSGESSTTLPAPQFFAVTTVLAAFATSVTVPTALERPCASWLIAVATLRGSFSSGARTRAVMAGAQTRGHPPPPPPPPRGEGGRGSAGGGGRGVGAKGGRGPQSKRRRGVSPHPP